MLSQRCFTAFDDLSLILRESSPDLDYEPSTFRWTDDEIARVRLVLRRLASLRILNPEDAEDLVQETLLTMLTKQPREALRKGLLVWAMGILRRKIGNYYRRPRRNGPLDEIAEGRRFRSLGRQPGSCPESQLLGSEFRTHVRRLITSLGPPDRRVLELLLEGCRAKEIAADLLPQSYQSVANRLHRSRRKLARELARLGYGPASARAGLRGPKLPW